MKSPFDTFEKEPFWLEGTLEKLRELGIDRVDAGIFRSDKDYIVTTARGFRMTVARVAFKNANLRNILKQAMRAYWQSFVDRGVIPAEGNQSKFDTLDKKHRRMYRKQASKMVRTVIYGGM